MPSVWFCFWRSTFQTQTHYSHNRCCRCPNFIFSRRVRPSYHKIVSGGVKPVWPQVQRVQVITFVSLSCAGGSSLRACCFDQEGWHWFQTWTSWTRRLSAMQLTGQSSIPKSESPQQLFKVKLILRGLHEVPKSTAACYHVNTPGTATGVVVSPGVGRCWLLRCQGLCFCRAAASVCLCGELVLMNTNLWVLKHAPSPSQHFF